MYSPDLQPPSEKITYFDEDVIFVTEGTFRSGSIKMDMVNLFVSIEGLKGSGKTTISKMLAARLGAEWYTTPPEIFRSVRDAVEAKASPLAKHLFYYSGIVQASMEISLILKNRPVVCDKYAATMIAYSRASGISVEYPLFDQVLLPDFSFFLEVPEAMRFARIQARGNLNSEQEAFLQMEVKRDVIQHFRELNLLRQDNGSDDASTTLTAIEQIIRHSSVVQGKVCAVQRRTGERTYCKL